MAANLDGIRSFVDQGDYQTAYNQARAAGFGLDDISSWVNKNYGTNWKGTDLANSYEKGSMENLNANNYRYATYSNGIGQGTPYNVPTAVNGPKDPFNIRGLTSADFANYSTNPLEKTQAQQVMSRTSGNTVIGPFPGNPSSAGGVPNLPNPNSNNNNTNLTNYNQNTPQTDLSLGLPALYPRRRANQSFNRGNNYFNMSSGNYQNRFA